MNKMISLTSSPEIYSPALNSVAEVHYHNKILFIFTASMRVKVLLAYCSISLVF